MILICSIFTFNVNKIVVTDWSLQLHFGIYTCNIIFHNVMQNLLVHTQFRNKDVPLSA